MSLKEQNSGLSLPEVIDNYNAVLCGLLDKHAPKRRQSVTIHPNAKWFTKEIQAEQRKRRQLGRKWKKIGLAIDKEIHHTQRNLVNKMCDAAECEYVKKQLEEANEQKDVYHITNKLLHRVHAPVFPKHDSLSELTERFAEFYEDKIIKIREKMPLPEPPSNKYDLNSETVKPLCTFMAADLKEICEQVSQSKASSCELDPIPTWLLKSCVNELAPVLMNIVNLSLMGSDVPGSLKNALVKPLLKKHGLDPEELNNYRPVSNLSYLSKLIERVVAKRLTDHLMINKLYEKRQSAYREFHSTETALIRVHNDLLRAISENGGAILILLDLSAAFDTIDHELLLNILEHQMQVKEDALQWFRSYLSDRVQSVSIDGVESVKRKLRYGVPQGSVLGPILFTIYTSSLSDLIQPYGIQYHLYADDTQLYITFDPTSKQSAEIVSENLEKCALSIRSWMDSHLLKLNDSKTELLVITSKWSKILGKTVIPSITIGESEIIPNDGVRNLGVLFDATMSMEKQVKNVCKLANHQIRNVSLKRRMLDVNTSKMLVHAFVSSRLDYCNALLYGIPQKLIGKMKHVQHIAACVVTKTHPRSHITPVLKDLHWLPIEQ